MTNTPDISPVSPPDVPGTLAGGMFIAALLLLCGTVGGFCWWLAGPTLGLFIGPPALLAIILPQVTSICGSAKARWLVGFIASTVVAIVWFTALPDISEANARQVGKCVILLLSFDLLLVGLTGGLIASGIRPTAAAAVVTILALLWLTWPIWLSSHLEGHLGETVATALVSAHPIYAMNIALNFDMWDHVGMMYSSLSTLNQDVAYRAPRSVWTAVWIHALPGIAVLIMSPLIVRHRRGKVLPKFLDRSRFL